jgi:hypothetical protein
MDNRINEIRRKISVLRAEMIEVEGAIRNQITHDLDCTESATRLMAMRQELAALVGDWKAAGGGDRLPTVQERLKENHRSSEKSEKNDKSGKSGKSEKLRIFARR